MAKRFSPAFSIRTESSPKVSGRSRPCDWDHSRIEDLRLFVFTGKIAASALWLEVACCAEGIRGPPLFAGQKPYPTWRQALPPPDDPGRDPPAKEPVAAPPPSVAPQPRRWSVVSIVIGLSFAILAVALVGFLATLTSRPAPT